MPLQTIHDHKGCMNDALKTAEKVCVEKGVRLTALRKRILEIICTSHKAVGAYALLDIFKQEDPKAKPVTIYRALDFLMDAGLVHKIESLNAYIACMQAGNQHKTAILICDECSNAYEIEASSFYEGLFQASKEQNFSPDYLIVELHGRCAKCH